MTIFELELQPLSLCGQPIGDRFKIKAKGDTWKQAFLNYLADKPGEGYLCRGYLGVNNG